MASKQGKLQQRNKRAVSKLLARPSQDRSSDTWSFLERIDAPQWVDLSMEESLMGEEGFDSWFDRSHKHHAMSLAGLNSNMSWLLMGKSKQSKGPILFRNNSRGCQKEANKPEKKRIVGHLNKSGNGQSQSQRQVTGLPVHKGAQSSNNVERGSTAHRLYSSVKTGCTLSGSSSTSECKSSGSFAKNSLCSDRSSVSSSLQAYSVESKTFSSNPWRGSSKENLSEDFYDTPTSCIGGAQRSRNSSSASHCPPMVKSSYSFEVGVSTCTKSRYSSEIGVLTATKSHLVCEASRQSSGDSGVTAVSGALLTSNEQVDKGCARIWEEEANDKRNIRELQEDVDCNQPLRRGFITDSSTVNTSLLHCQLTSDEVVKSGIKVGRQRLEKNGSQAGLLPGKKLYAGKENAPPKENITAANLTQVKDKPSRSKAPLAVASSKTMNAMTVGLTSGGGFLSSEVRKKEGPQCATQVVPSKRGLSQNLNSSRASSVSHQRKRSEAKQLPVACEKISNSERDLAALVAQHNQKIRSLGLQSCRKGLR